MNNLPFYTRVFSILMFVSFVSSTHIVFATHEPLGTNVVLSDICSQSDGTYYAVGSVVKNNRTMIMVVRYLSNGTPDSSWGEDGSAVVIADIGYESEGKSIAIQNNQKVVVAGNCDDDIVVLRYNRNGTLDQSFGDYGIFRSNLNQQEHVNRLLVTQDNHIVLVGTASKHALSHVLLVQLNPNGSYSSSFGSQGIITQLIAQGSVGFDAVEVAHHNIVIAGTAIVDGQAQFMALKYNNHGQLDSSFGRSGVALEAIGPQSSARAIGLGRDGSLYLVGSSVVNSFKKCTLLKLNPNGAKNTVFGYDGIVTLGLLHSMDELYGLSVTHDNKLVVVGSSGTEAVTAQLYENGQLDDSFGGSGVVTTQVGDDLNGYALASLSNGSLIVAGNMLKKNTESGVLFAYNQYGELDDAFGDHGIVVYPEGSIWGTPGIRYQATSQLVDASTHTMITREIGPTGATGATGPQGIQGATGPQGDQGSIGSAGVDVTGSDYAYAYDTTTQGVYIANTMQDITFSTNVYLDQWSHTAGTSSFTCATAGKYQVAIRMQMHDATFFNAASTLSARATLGGAEVYGSHMAVMFGALKGQTQVSSNVFIIDAEEDDILKFQFTGSKTTDKLLSGTGIGVIKPSVSVVITRIV